MKFGEVEECSETGVRAVDLIPESGSSNGRVAGGSWWRFMWRRVADIIEDSPPREPPLDDSEVGM